MQYANILILCEYSIAMSRFPESREAIRVLIEEGMSVVNPDSKIRIINFGNDISHEMEWIEDADKFDKIAMFRGSDTGVSNIYHALNGITSIISSHPHEDIKWIIVLCTYCGSSDYAELLTSDTRDFLKSYCTCIIVYGDEQIQSKIPGFVVSSDSIFTAGSDSESNRFAELMRDLTYPKSILHKKTNFPLDEEFKEDLTDPYN